LLLAAQLTRLVTEFIPFDEARDGKEIALSHARTLT
jgi:hypothetical protein